MDCTQCRVEFEVVEVAFREEDDNKIETTVFLQCIHER